jgi:integrase
MGRDHGDGGIDERGKDRFRLRYRVGGKRYTKTVRGNITDAKRELRRLLKSGDDGAHVAPARMTFSLWKDRWVELREGKVNPRTLERYAELLKLHVIPSLGARVLQTITPTMIDDVYRAMEGKGLRPRTVRQVHAVLGACFRSALQKNLLQQNPVERADAPSPGETEVGQALDQDKLVALLNGLRGTAFFPIAATAAYTGARRGEILALQWSDLDFEEKTLRIERAVEETKAHGLRFKEPKTERGRRTIVIDDGLIALFKAEREKHLRLIAGVPDGVAVDVSMVKLPVGSLVFPHYAGKLSDLAKPRNPRAVTKGFIDRANALGFTKFRFHDLRVTHETMLLDAGVPVHVVAARCGHDPAVLLRVYAKRTRKADTSAAAVIGALSKAVLRS